MSFRGVTPIGVMKSCRDSRLLACVWLCLFQTAMVLVANPSWAASNSGITYTGRLVRPDGLAVQGANVQFKLQIRTPGNENCLLFEETQSLDMRNSEGMFSITMNDGSGTRSDSSGYSLDAIFANRGMFTFAPGACMSGSFWIPNLSDGRKFVVTFRDENMTYWEPLPAMTINFTPMAIEAKQISGFTAFHLLRFDDAAAAQNMAPMTLAQLTELKSLIGGTSSQYMKSPNGGGLNLPVVASAPASPATGAIWFDSSTGSLRYFDGSASRTVDTSTASGSVTSVTAGSGLLGGTITSSGTISMPNVGSPGSYFRVTTDQQGRVVAGENSLVEADIPTLTSAGKVSGSAINSGTIAGSTAISTSGAIATTSSLTASSLSSTTIAAQVLRLFDSSNSRRVTLVAPNSLAQNISFTLPSVMPSSSGQVLSSDTSGNMSWITPSAGGVTSLTATAPLASSGGSTPVLSLPRASTSADGYLARSDWDAFDAKMSRTLASGQIWVGSGLGQATSVALSGDASMDNSGSLTVTRLQGRNIDSLAPSASGQVLRWDQTTSRYSPTFLSLQDLRSIVTPTNTIFPASGCGADKALNWSVLTDSFTCQSIALSGSQISSGVVAISRGGTGSTDGSITGSGALTFTAGGSDQSITLTPSGAGSTILYGNVGVGTNAPGEKLTVNGRVESTDGGFKFPDGTIQTTAANLSASPTLAKFTLASDASASTALLAEDLNLDSDTFALSGDSRGILIKKSGYYMIHGMVRMAGGTSGDDMEGFVAVNNVDKMAFYPTASSNSGISSASFSNVFSLSANDVVKIYSKNAGQGALKADNPPSGSFSYIIVQRIK